MTIALPQYRSWLASGKIYEWKIFTIIVNNGQIIGDKFWYRKYVYKSDYLRYHILYELNLKKQLDFYLYHNNRCTIFIVVQKISVNKYSISYLNYSNNFTISTLRIAYNINSFGISLQSSTWTFKNFYKFPEKF